MVKAQIKLLIITLLSFFLAGFFLVQGFQTPSESVNQIKEIVFSAISTPEPSAIPVQTENKAILPEAPAGYVQAEVKKVVDGDTIEVSIDKKNYKLRYIGIDTPETVDPNRPVGCFGKEASNENKRVVDGKQVFLEKDISETDKFGRLLRYVYIKLSDGSYLFVNDYLVRAGYAQASTYPPDVKYQDRFLDAQGEARLNNRGLWSKCQTK